MLCAQVISSHAITVAMLSEEYDCEIHGFVICVILVISSPWVSRAPETVVFPHRQER